MRLCAALLVLVAALIAAEARAEARIALVIGNSDYVAQGPLANPAKDAALMTASLLATGFTVFELTNADQRAIKRALRDFGRRLRQAGPDAVGLFYYAGHGVQARGTNYLIPLGAQIEDEADLELEAVSADALLAQMESAGNALNIVILDACRNNPFKSSFRAPAGGLARMDAPSGSLVAYAAAPGQVAADGRGDHSPYTAALAAAIREPGLELLKVFQKVRIAVQSETDGRQTSWEEQSLLGDFYFVPIPASQASTGTGGSQDPDAGALELAFWNSVQDSTNPAVLETYLERYPDGVFSGLARVKIGALRSSSAASPGRTQSAGTPQSPADGAFYAGDWCERIGQYLVRWEVVHLFGDQVQTRMNHPAAPPRFLPNATVTPTAEGLRLDFEAGGDGLAPQVFTVLDADTIRRNEPAPADGMTGIRKRCKAAKAHE